MAKSHFPGGFRHGLNVRGVNILETHAGEIFYVDSGAGADSGGNDGTENKPFATVDYAVSKCTANNGDLILLKPGHAEAVTTNDQIDIDVAGVTVAGLGEGPDRPTFTWSGTDATACITLAANGTRLLNCLLISSDTGDNITGMVRIEADDCEIGHCEAREGDGQAESVILISDGADRAYIHDNRITSFTNGAAANDGAIEFSCAATGIDGMTIVNNYIHGTWDQGCIWCSDATAVCSGLTVQDNTLINTASSLYAIDLTAGTNMTGAIIGNRVSTDAEATSIRGGGCDLFDNSWALNSLQSAAAGQSAGLLMSVANGVTVGGVTDELATVTSAGAIVMEHMIAVITTVVEAQEAVLFDNITTGSSGNLYTPAAEFVLDDVAAGEPLHFGQAAPAIVEASANLEDARPLGWLIAASDTIDYTSVGATETEGVGAVIMVYRSLGGELEVEAP